MNHNDLPVFSCNLLSQTTLVSNIIELSFTRPEGFDWQVGDYLWLGSENGDFKPFSIANLPNESVINLQVAIVPTLTEWLTNTLKQSTLQMKGAVSQYHWPDNNQPIMMLAGGTGITPLLALLQGHQESLSSQLVQLYWGVRHNELLFARETLDALVRRYSNFTWLPIVSEPNLQWTGLTGLLPDVLVQKSVSLTDCNLMICGPWPMVKILKQIALDQGVTLENIQ